MSFHVEFGYCIEKTSRDPQDTDISVKQMSKIISHILMYVKKPPEQTFYNHPGTPLEWHLIAFLPENCC